MNQRRERLYRTEAVILRRSDIGEADRLLTCYTPTRGKIRVIAKGARKITSRKAGHIELFIHSALLIAKGKTWTGLRTRTIRSSCWTVLQQKAKKTGRCLSSW